MNRDNPERVNARQWDQESSISVAPSIPPGFASYVLPGFVATQAPLINFGDGAATDDENLSTHRQSLQTGANRYHWDVQQRDIDPSSARENAAGVAGSRVPEFARGLHNQRTNGRQGIGYHVPDASGRVSSGHKNDGNSGQSGRPFASNQGRSRRSQGRGRGNNDQRNSVEEKRKVIWAEPPPLVTTPLLRVREAAAFNKADREKYFEPIEDDEEFLGNGYYLWHNKEETPMALLGWKLEELNPIRLTHKVWIEWQEDTRSLKIGSKSVRRPELYVMDAINGIRNAIGHAKARPISASPQYIVFPPTTNGMRTIVRPRTLGVKYATDVELAGEMLSEEQKETWKKSRADIVKDNHMKLQESLTKSLREIAPYRGWMRMRVHFGHIVFTEFRQDFEDSKSSFEKFDRMMGMSRTTAHLERKLDDATIAIKLMKRIIDWPTRFLPVAGAIEELKDVDFKDTEVVFVTIPTGQCLRIEGEIDRTTDEYQVGAVSLFEDNQTNKRVEITAIDVEKQVDWNIEVITDNSIKEWPPQLDSLIRGSVTAKSQVRKDPLGLEYPSVSPRAPIGVHISRVVVRSVIKYQLRDSGYIVEIAVYRIWDGDDVSGEPRMATSASMYHPAWEWEMESIEHSTKVREWSKKPGDLFNHGTKPEACGLQALLDEVGVIQGFLSSIRLASPEQN